MVVYHAVTYLKNRWNEMLCTSYPYFFIALDHPGLPVNSIPAHPAAFA